MDMVRLVILPTLGLLAGMTPACGNGGQELILGSTTSVQDAGLLDALIAGFEKQYGYNVKPIVGGSGQILEQGRRGEMDVLMTHSPADEEGLISLGYATERTPVMQNLFLIVGPADDPAGVRDTESMEAAFRRITYGEHLFVSRGDGSGTHKRELWIWDSIGIDPEGKKWYTESAAGQGQSLLLASDRGAYTLVDSSTFISFADWIEVVELLRDEERPNIYSVITLNPANVKHINQHSADDWLEFMTREGQEIIAEFGREEYGQALFEPLIR